MIPYGQTVRSLGLTAFALIVISLYSSSAWALDWRIIQDGIGRASNGQQGEILFEEDFEKGPLGEYPGHPGVQLVKDPDGKGLCVQFSTSEFQLKNRIPIQAGHWIGIRWKSRTLSYNGDESRPEGVYLELSYQDAEGKVVAPTPVLLPRGSAVRQASSGDSSKGWSQRFWSLELPWGSTSRHTTVVPPDARSIGLRFFHDSDNQMVTLIDDIRVVDVQPAALRVVADTIAKHRHLLSTAIESIRVLPETPEARSWKQVVANHGDRVKAKLDGLAEQDPTSDEFIHGSDPFLLFAQRLADADKALKTAVANPETILTYWTRPIPAMGPFEGNVRRDPVGVLPYAWEIEGELANKVTIQACRGEFEPISIALWSPENMDQVSVHASDLKGSAGLISASNLDIKVIKWWYQNNQRKDWYGFLVPKFLLNDDALVKVDLEERRNYLKLSFPEGSRYVDLPSADTDDLTGIEEEIEAFPLRDSDSLQPFDLIGGQNKQVWITVKVPDDAAAGEYSGDIVFKVGDRKIARFKVIVRVLPFSLPTPKTRYDPSQDYTFSFYYRGKLAPDGKGKIGFKTKSEQQFRAELQMMYEHGIVAPLMLFHGSYPGGVRPASLFRRHLEIMRETGMSGRPLYLGDNIFQRTEERLTWLRQDLRGTISIARECGFTGVYFYGQDEAPREVMREQIPTWQVAHEVGAKVQVAVTHGELNYVPDELDLLIAIGLPNRERAAKRHRLGGKIHSYGAPSSTEPDPLVYRRNCGLLGWINNYDGTTPYCFMHNGKGVWNDLDGIDYNIAYPTMNGVISTLALEAFREGADDVRYATLLMNRIEEARRSGESEAMALAKRASEWIEKEDFSTADLDAARATMIAYISKMTR